jgi:hypothetical protein
MIRKTKYVINCYEKRNCIRKATSPKITEVKPLEDWKLHLILENEEERIFDMKPYRYGVFVPLKDPDYFQRLRIVNGSIFWPHNQKLHYGMLYKKSKALATQSSGE